jgi:hypothetical protein
MTVLKVSNSNLPQTGFAGFKAMSLRTTLPAFSGAFSLSHSLADRVTVDQVCFSGKSPKVDSDVSVAAPKRYLLDFGLDVLEPAALKGDQSVMIASVPRPEAIELAVDELGQTDTTIPGLEALLTINPESQFSLGDTRFTLVFNPQQNRAYVRSNVDDDEVVLTEKKGDAKVDIEGEGLTVDWEKDGDKLNVKLTRTGSGETLERGEEDLYSIQADADHDVMSNIVYQDSETPGEPAKLVFKNSAEYYFGEDGIAHVPVTLADGQSVMVDLYLDQKTGEMFTRLRNPETPFVAQPFEDAQKDVARIYLANGLKSDTLGIPKLITNPHLSIGTLGDIQRNLLAHLENVESGLRDLYNLESADLALPEALKSRPFQLHNAEGSKVYTDLETGDVFRFDADEPDIVSLGRLINFMKDYAPERIEPAKAEPQKPERSFLQRIMPGGK